jgi:hypothetical protein
MAVLGVCALSVLDDWTINTTARADAERVTYA